MDDPKDIEIDGLRGRELYRYVTTEADNITGNDDIGAEHVVMEVPKAMAGLIVFGRRRGESKFIANWGDRHIIRQLLKGIGRIP